MREMSGEEGVGSGWVGTGPLSATRELQSTVAATVSPRAAARSQLVLENQASLCAFRSPSTSVSASEESKGNKVSSVRTCPGQLDDLSLQVYKDGDYGPCLDLDTPLAQQTEDLDTITDR